MAEGKTPGFLALFLERYNDFRNQLKRRLGSEDLAHDAMQEAFLKVNELPPGMPVQQPAAYLFRMALNAAEDHRRRDSRLLTGVEIGELINVADEASDPRVSRRAAARSKSFAGRCAGCLSAPSRCCWPRACMNACRDRQALRRVGAHRLQGNQARAGPLRPRARAMNRAGSHGRDDAAREESGRRAEGRGAGLAVVADVRARHRGRRGRTSSAGGGRIPGMRPLLPNSRDSGARWALR